MTQVTVYIPGRVPHRIAQSALEKFTARYPDALVASAAPVEAAGKASTPGCDTPLRAAGAVEPKTLDRRDKKPSSPAGNSPLNEAHRPRNPEQQEVINLSNFPTPVFGPAIAHNPRGGTLVAGNILSGNVCPQLGVMPWAEAGGVAEQDRLELFPELTNEHVAGAIGARGLEHAAIRIPGQTRPVRSVIEDITEFPCARMPVSYPGLRSVLHFKQAPERDGEFIRIRYKATTNIVGLAPYLQRLSPQAVAEGDSIPEHMDGGLAFYHPYKCHSLVGRANYMTGKIAELPRPYLQNLDGDGQVVSHHWGQWDTSEWESAKVLVKVIPASAIDPAAISWAIDATMGYTGEGALYSNSIRTGVNRANKALLGHSGEVTLLRVFDLSDNIISGKTCKNALYDGSGTQPVNLLAQTGDWVAATQGDKEWAVGAFPANTVVTLSPSVDYWVTWATITASLRANYYDAVPYRAVRWNRDYATEQWADPAWGPSTIYDALRYSVYLEYEEAGGGLPFSRNRYGELSGYSRGRFGGS